MPQDQLRDKSNAQEQSAQLRLGKYRIRLPRSRVARVALGLALLAGGMLFFLPVLGLWMLPLGVVILSGEFAAARRWRRRLAIWWGRRKKATPGHKEGPDDESGPKALGNGGVSSRADAGSVAP